MSEKRNLPIGIQSFEEIRRKGCVYVDKTQYVRPLLSIGKPYFL
ncbi:MAG: AAA family ATPase, partial [Treponema sp.]|nr:AAA family ATPase [Treponema sp.]MBR0030950.1 AAA family ATPase [Treponema sp.]MBR0031223.1 AAA family ATPase [Treponema sp.]